MPNSFKFANSVMNVSSKTTEHIINLAFHIRNIYNPCFHLVGNSSSCFLRNRVKPRGWVLKLLVRYIAFFRQMFALHLLTFLLSIDFCMQSMYAKYECPFAEIQN